MLRVELASVCTRICIYVYMCVCVLSQVVFEAVDPITHQFSLAAPGCRRIGGKLAHPPQPGESLQLRVLLDYSLLEIFTGEHRMTSHTHTHRHTHTHTHARTVLARTALCF